MCVQLSLACVSLVFGGVGQKEDAIVDNKKDSVRENRPYQMLDITCDKNNTKS